MSLEFKIQGQGGESGVVDTNHIVSQLQQAGYTPQGVSADGMTMTLVDDSGPYEVKTADVLKNLGWEVKGATPPNADYDNIQHGWRAAITKLPDDDSRKAYIEGQMKRAGVAEPQITGGGRDWFVFNPGTQQWIGVTNSPQWDASDAVEFGLEAPRMVASALGGGAGALAGAGAGSIPLAMVGAGLAGGAADAATRGVVAAVDPVYRDVASKNLGGIAKDVGIGAGMDAATMGLFKGLGPAARFLSPKLGAVAEGAMNLAPISRTAKAAGQTMQSVGGGMKGLASMADNSMGHELASFAIPGASEAQSAGFLMQAPAWMTKAGVKGMDALGNSSMIRQYAPNFARKMTSFAGRLGEDTAFAAPIRSQAFQQGAEALAGRMGGAPAAETTAEEALKPSNIMANLFQEGRIRAGQMFGNIERKGATDLGMYRTAREAGLPPNLARDFGEDSLHEFLGRENAAGAKWAGYGRKFGEGIEHLDKLGGSLQRGATKAGKAVVQGTRATGAGLHGAGTALRGVGTVTQPIESRAAMRYGAEEAFGPAIEDELTRRRRARSGTMNGVLAQN